MRETLFNVLGPGVAGSCWLDLFAGSGSVGLEALSRGARHCTFVDKRRVCVRAIRANLERIGVADGTADGRADIVLGDARRAVRSLAQSAAYEFAFVDPPYGFAGLDRLLTDLLHDRLALAAGAVVVVQHRRGQRCLKAFAPFREKGFGDSVLAFFDGGDAACD